jgi:hypothetical protein
MGIEWAFIGLFTFVAFAALCDGLVTLFFLAGREYGERPDGC